MPNETLVGKGHAAVDLCIVFVRREGGRPFGGLHNHAKLQVLLNLYSWNVLFSALLS
jgi:hypothetical protein